MPTRFSGTRAGAVFGSTLSKRKGSYQGVKSTAYLRGADELLRALQRIDAATADANLAQATLASAEVLREAWKAAVPVEDGNYRDSLTAEASPGKVGATAVVYPGEVAGLPQDEQPRNYAARLEFGSASQTKKQATAGRFVPGRTRAAQPSLRPAYDANAGRMVEAMSDELRTLIEGAN